MGSRLHWSRSIHTPLAERIIKASRKKGYTPSKFITSVLEANV